MLSCQTDSAVGEGFFLPPQFSSRINQIEEKFLKTRRTEESKALTQFPVSSRFRGATKYWGIFQRFIISCFRTAG
jgi:hypothetical protein